MNAAVVREVVVRGVVDLTTDRIVLLAYAGGLFLSAALLIFVQPMVARIALPALGGSPSVWAVQMCFFQAALLAGYGYAHVLDRYVRPHHVPFFHLLLLGVALMVLPFGLPASAEAPPSDGASLWLIGVLTAGVGLPFFAVAANLPLLQAWFARTRHPNAADPYFLYGVCNLGALLALLSYPVLPEPLFELSKQTGLWTLGFMLLGLMILICGLLLIVRIRVDPAATPVFRQPKVAGTLPMAWTSRFHWLALAMVPSGLLVAFVANAPTGLASVPLFWTIPLAAFLGSFAVVFWNRPLVPMELVRAVYPGSIFAVGLCLLVPSAVGVPVVGPAVGFAAFLTTTLVCHRALYDSRPDSAHLTEFYAWMSFGGLLGGSVAAFVMPHIVGGGLGFLVLLLAGLALRPGQTKIGSKPTGAERE